MPTPPASPQSADDAEIPELRDYPAVMTPAQVAAALQINDQVVRKKLNAGQWPGFRVGTSAWRMRRLAVRAIILGQDPWLTAGPSATGDTVTGEAEEPTGQ